MRVSLIGTTLGLTVAALAIGCGPTVHMAVLPTTVHSLTQAFDPIAQIRKVAEQVWNEMETTDFESRTQVVSSQGQGAPKYAFLNVAADTQDPGTVLYRAGTYALSNPKVNVTLSFVSSAAQRARQNPAAIAAATRAIKNAIKADWGHNVTGLHLSEQQHGPKYVFVAESKNQPNDDGTGTMDWVFPGSYATSTQTVSVSIGIGHGTSNVNTAKSYRIDKRPAPATK